MADLPTFSTTEVAAHSTRDDLHVIIAGKVYDITQYLRDHPGGVDVLLDVAGKDATEAYTDVGHSEDADEILATYLVGTVGGSDQKTIRSKNVKLIPQDTAATTAKRATVSTPYRMFKLGATSFALTGAAFCIWSFGPAVRRILPSSSISLMPSSLTTSSGTTTFIGGFVVSSLLSTIGATIIAKQLARFTHIESGFTKYPPRRKQRMYIKPTNPHRERGFLDPKEYKSLELIRIDHLSPNVCRYTFKLPNTQDVVGLPIGQHVAIKATIDGKQVNRSYTPVSNNLDKGILQLVIKIYPDGLLTGKYFANLKVGDNVLFRGPKGAYTHTSGQVQKLGMIAGGTGITPMYQLIRAICEDEYDTTEISLILANRTEADILLREELETFARRYPKNFKLWFMLDHPPESWQYGSGFVTADVMKARLPAPGEQNKIMLCGPPGMVAASKKALESLRFKAPGPVAKMSDEIFCF